MFTLSTTFDATASATCCGCATSAICGWPRVSCKVRVGRWSWLYAFAWFLVAQQVCRLITPAELNVNVAHRIYSGWEQVFSAYWQFWLATTAAVAAGLWIMEIILSKLLPSSIVRA